MVSVEPHIGRPERRRRPGLRRPRLAAPGFVDLDDDAETRTLAGYAERAAKSAGARWSQVDAYDDISSSSLSRL
jgi:hypothetical protein